jgi:hydroxymethylglutaryl-CoA lyase
MDTVIINDVGPRDGLQNDPGSVAPADRVALIEALVSAGVPAVEVSAS